MLTDWGLRALNRMPQLRVLRLDHVNGITVKGMRMLMVGEPDAPATTGPSLYEIGKHFLKRIKCIFFSFSFFTDNFFFFPFLFSSSFLFLSYNNYFLKRFVVLYFDTTRSMFASIGGEMFAVDYNLHSRHSCR